MKELKKIIKIILTIVIVLFSYGLLRGIYDANFNSKSSLFTIGVTAYSMNPISASGYKIGVHSNPEIQERVNSLERDINSFGDY